MNRLIFLIVCLFASTCNAALSVTILYEALCPDSIRFMQNQLKPSYDSLKYYIDVVFVPFGKASSYNNGEYFQCQHGQDECDGNMMQSCVLNELIGQQDLQVNFVTCQMSYGSESSGKTCAESVGVSFGKVQDCINGGVGKQLQLDAEVKTKNVSPAFIPTILYDNVFNQISQDNSLYSFKNTVCSQINNMAPSC